MEGCDSLDGLENGIGIGGSMGRSEEDDAGRGVLSHAVRSSGVHLDELCTR